MVAVEKYHGTGNDFVVVEASADVADREAFAIAVCDRKTGISHPDSPRTGADGVLFLDPVAGDPPRVNMHLVQPDGSTAAMCGNGARVAAKWAARRFEREAQRASEASGQHPRAVTDVVVDTAAGARPATVDGDFVTIGMGEPTFDPRTVPVDSDGPFVEREVAGLTVTAVNTGVPHAVAFVDDVDDVDLESVAPPVRHADVFPEGANVNLASGEGRFRQRTFERGVEGETRSCGTGAVAIAAVACYLGRADYGAAISVSPPGGELEVTVPDSGAATLAGPVAREFETEVTPA